MADEVLVFDAAGSNVDGTDPGSPLSIGPGTSYPLISASFPAPPLNVLYASSIDTEGEVPVSRRYGNRTISLELEMLESGANNTLLDALVAKLAKLQREGGTLKRTRKDGSTIRIYDLVAADGIDPRYDLTYLLAHLSSVPIQLPAKPLARGAEVDLGDNTETTLPCLVFTEASVTGDAPGLGRLVIDEDEAVDQQWLTWGIQSANYSSSANAALFYEAEGRTAMGGSATAAGPSGASGGGSNVMRNTALSTFFQPVLSSQATGGGAHWSHIGSFRVYARVQVPATNTGTVSVALEWGEGDFQRSTTNSTLTIDPTWEDTWQLLDLGLVTLTATTAGTQRWEARVLAKSTVSNDDIDVDWLMLVPAQEGSGQVAGVERPASVTTFTARDEFDQSAGALVGKTAPVGGTWSGTGDADDFALNTSDKTARRTAVSDTTWRLNRLGSGTLTGTVVQVDFRKTATISGTALPGIFARYSALTDVFIVRANFASSGGSTYLFPEYMAVVGGGIVASTPVGFPAIPYVANTWYTIRLSVDTSGRFAVALALRGAALTTLASGNSSALATGGAIASGGYGIFDHSSGGTADTRDYDNFAVWSYASDAAMFASQSLEIRHNQVRREDSGGTLWTTPSSYVGDYLTVPPAGAEGRTTRVIVKASRNEPGVGPDAGTDNISARLFVTPRYL